MPNAKNPHPVTGETLPIVLGHESVLLLSTLFAILTVNRFSGTIVELGSEVDSKRLSVGQDVCV